MQWGLVEEVGERGGNLLESFVGGGGGAAPSNRFMQK